MLKGYVTRCNHCPGTRLWFNTWDGIHREGWHCFKCGCTWDPLHSVPLSFGPHCNMALALPRDTVLFSS